MITIDLVHDLICPWCRVGEHHLDAALAQRPDAPVRVRLHAYQLAPEIPPEGADYKAHLLRKFGDPRRLDAVHEHLRNVARPLGIAFNNDRIQRLPNTLKGHAFLAAIPEAQQIPVLRALQKAYFEDGADLTSPEVLISAAVSAGLTRDEAQLALDNSDLEATRQDAREMLELGITGVPAFLFSNDRGQRYAVSGAQPAEQLVRVIDALR